MPYSYPQPINKGQAIRQIWHLLPGALIFAGMAGYINSVALGFFHSPVSHMTGTVSYLGIDLAEWRLSDAMATLTIILGFIAGAALAGFIVGAQQLAPGRRYGVTLICEGVLLTAAMALLLARSRLGVPLVSMACGLQNAMTSSYCGLMIRTTHITGTVTDIGVMLGHWLRHRQIERWKLGFLLALVFAFGTGVLIGALADGKWGPASLSLVAAGCLVAGWGIWFFPHHPWLKIDNLDSQKSPKTSSFPNQ